MLQMESSIPVADNTGARVAKMIGGHLANPLRRVAREWNLPFAANSQRFFPRYKVYA